MKRIGVLSDTHGFIPKQVYEFFKDCDELWHAGDIGPGVLEELRAWKTVRAVWGNCDSFALHYELEEQAFFVVEGQRELMHCLEAGYDIDSLFICPELYNSSTLQDDASSSTLHASRFMVSQQVYE